LDSKVGETRVVLLRPASDRDSWFVHDVSEVRDRLKLQQANRINKEGYLALQAQEYRTQAQNRKAAISKLTEILKEAWPRPKIRKQREGPSKATKERNKEDKQKRSETKARRQRVDF
jgi:ribosome-associated protein